MTSAVHRRTLAAGLSLLLSVGVLSTGAQAAPRPQSTPLEESHLFISPAGEPYRSVSGQPYAVVQWFKATDTNGDGKVDRGEFKANAEKFFHVLDRNNDGVVNDPEMAYYEKVLVPELNASASSVDNNPTDDRTKLSTDLQGAAPYALINDAEPVRSADDSLQGRLTLKAFLARADHNFDVLDQNGRGYLVLEDLPRTQVQEAATPVRKR